MNDSPNPINSLPSKTQNGSVTVQPGSETISYLPADIASPVDEATELPASAGGSSASATVIQQFIGDYLVVRKIGEGGMGAVYLAEDSKLHRRAAVKTMRRELAADPTHRERFLREARAAAAVEHDNIVPIWQIGESADGSPFIAMPFLQGEPLDVRLKRQTLPGLGLVVKVAREVADALAAAHARGLIHRDIKPANVWLEGDPAATDPAQQVRRCKVLDFGLARSTEQDDGHLTASGAIMGTPAYMAPEQARGEQADQRADLWSLGVMLYRMATGEMPFKGANTMAILTELITKTPSASGALNPNLPPELAALIDRLMCKDPAGRPSSAAEVAATVRQIVKNLQAKKGAAAAVPAILTAPPAIPIVVTPTSPPSVVTEPVSIWEGVTETETGPKGAVPARPKASAEVTERKVPESVGSRRKPRAKSAGRPGRMPWFVAGGVFAFLALIVAAVVIIRIETPEGTLVVELNGPDVEARIKDGRLVLDGSDGKDRYTITPGERNKKIDAAAYTVRVEGADGLALDTREFTLKKNGQVTVRVMLDPKTVAKKPDSEPNLNSDRKAAEYVLSIGGMVKVNGQERAIKAAAGLPREAFQLTFIDLGENKKVTDAWLVALKECRNVTHLHLYGSPVSDAGMAHFKDWKNLTVLDLNDTGVSDAGPTYFKNCKDLISLGLAGSKVSDAGLAGIGDWKQLEKLFVHFTTVSDASVPHMKECKNLNLLTLRETNITAKGLDELKKAIPGCKIDWDGVVMPGANLTPDRKAAEYVLSMGGGVMIHGENREFAAVKDLPRNAFRLAGIFLNDKDRVTDAGLAVFKGCKDLTLVKLIGTLKISDDGLANFKECENLTELNLNDCPQLSDAGLAHFKACKNLTVLHLNGSSQFGDSGLAHFKNCDKLTLLYLNGTRVSDTGLGLFKGYGNLMHLGLYGTQVSDTGLTHFKDCANLVAADVRGTKITAKKIAEVKKFWPNCKIEWDGGVIEPTKK